MTTENDEYLLAQSPQEWKWLLQDEGLIADEEPAGSSSGDDDVPDVACTIPDLTTDSTENIGEALDWLQRACAYDLKSQESHLDSTRKKCDAAQNQIASLEKRLRQDKQLYNDLPKDIGTLHTSSKILLEETISKFMSEVLQPRCLELIQEGWIKHAHSMRPILQQYQRALLSMAPPQRVLDTSLQTLQQVLEKQIRIDSLEAYQFLCIDIQELQSFLQTRHRLLVKKSIPSFFTVIATIEDDDKLADHVAVLRNVLDDMAPPTQMFVWWCLWQEDAHRNEWIAQYIRVQERCQASTTALQQLQDEDHEDVKEMEESQVNNYRAQIQQVKHKLEAKITALFDFEDLIEIAIS